MKNIDLSELREGYRIEQWNSEIKRIHEELEKPNWAPWLSFSYEGMIKMFSVFPEGQLVIKDMQNGRPLAYISTNRINWDGTVKNLPTWDSVAGEAVGQADYHTTYTNDGNTLVIMCLTADSEYHGKHLPALLIEETKHLAKKLGAKYLISPFRPTNYGEYKIKHKGVSLKEYITTRREDGLPIDGWLRNVERNGMKSLTVRENSLVVSVPKAEFLAYKASYHPSLWKEVALRVWECAEAGLWYLSDDIATYSEPEVWGMIEIN